MWPERRWVPFTRPLRKQLATTGRSCLLYTRIYTHSVLHTHTHTHIDSLVSELSWKWLALRFLRLRCAYSSQRDLTWLNHDIEEDNDNVCWWSSTDGGNNYVDVDYLLPGCCTPQRFLIKLMKCILWLLATAQPENNQHSHDDDNLIQTIEWRFMGSLKIASICSFLIPQPSFASSFSINCSSSVDNDGLN